MLIDDFTDAPDTRGRVLSDQVMGGVSQGQAGFGADGARHFVRLTGTVSTENRGGFLQVRRTLPALPATAQGFEITVRGNGQRYFLHLGFG